MVLNAPWELLATEAEGFLALGQRRYAPFRRLGTPVAPPVLDDYRLGVAFMAAAPRGVSDLDYEREEAAIQDATPEGVDLLVVDSGDPEDLGWRLAALEPSVPVLHLSCHGHNAWRHHSGEVNQSVLMLENETGELRPTTAYDLVSAISASRPRMVFLSACLSASANTDVASGKMAQSLASALVTAGIPAVLGWDGSVSDTGATVFAKALYSGLSHRLPPPEAAAVARQKLMNRRATTDFHTNQNTSQALHLESHIAADDEAAARDWHLARIWLGPEGGHPLVKGQRKRSPIGRDEEYKRVLKRKDDEALIVAGAGMFVGRRRELQKALAVIRAENYAGVLLHGMGRLGKTSLAARIASRRRDLTLAVVYGDYDALAVLDALETVMLDHPPARTLLLEGRRALEALDTLQRARALEAILVDLLADRARRSDRFFCWWTTWRRSCSTSRRSYAVCVTLSGPCYDPFCARSM